MVTELLFLEHESCIELRVYVLSLMDMGHEAALPLSFAVHKGIVYTIRIPL